MKMLICSIGSKRRKSTLKFAVQVAQVLGTDTTLLGVVPSKRQVQELGQTLETAAAALANQGVPVQVLVEAGNAEDIVVKELEQTSYDLVAVGALGGQRSPRAFFDSFGMRIVERAKHSVLMIKGDRPSLSRVLICASGTEVGHVAVFAGSSLACGARAQATVLHVVNALPAMYTGLEQMEETLAELLQSESDMARELKWAANVVKEECEIAEVKLRRGIVADEILREGQEGDYDLIVMGSSRSASGLVRVLMGDLTREVVSRAQRPVLVVRPSGSLDHPL
jgi:nucleotide-binding universal stress UspA family protein